MDLARRHEDSAQVGDGPAGRYEYGEDRLIAYGEMGPCVVAVVYVLRRDIRRLISARQATKAEAKVFHEVMHGK
jgi:uncharacterized DUF497 family protein